MNHRSRSPGTRQPAIRPTEAEVIGLILRHWPMRVDFRRSDGWGGHTCVQSVRTCDHDVGGRLEGRIGGLARRRSISRFAWW